MNQRAKTTRTRRHTLSRFCVIFCWTATAGLLCIASTGSRAQSSPERESRPGWHVAQPSRFFVSGVLRKNGTTNVIKVTHGIYVAESADVALRQFMREAQENFDGYSVLTTLVSAVPRSGRCERVI